MNRQLAYCTNVHAGSDLESMRANLERHALAVKERFSPERPMGIGLWVAAPAAKKLLESDRLGEFASWIADQSLVPFTLNGFPYGDFHEPLVKHRVYHPTWFDSERLDFTMDLVQILHAILPAGVEGSISTLPLAWRFPEITDQHLLDAARHLGQLADQLSRLEQDTGRLITICIEPEPGCLLQRYEDMVRFFNDYLCTDGQSPSRRRYIRVCHDICHAAVMFEDQREAFAGYSQNGIQVGKIQVSSALQVDFDQLEPGDRGAMTKALGAFAEDRYLHQTTMRLAPGEPPAFYDDLPQALAAAEADQDKLRGTWRVHFHVPIYLRQFGMIGTTQDEIRECLRALEPSGAPPHFEIETYAWGVLPAELQREELADGIAEELQWFSEL